MTALTIEAHDLHAGDILSANDWQLHINHVVLPEAPATAVAVAVAEFGFLLHYAYAQHVTVERAS